MGADNDPVSGIPFDPLGPFVTGDEPDDPAEAVAQALEPQGVSVPADRSGTFGERRMDSPGGAEIPLTDHAGAGATALSITRAPIPDVQGVVEGWG